MRRTTVLSACSVSVLLLLTVFVFPRLRGAPTSSDVVIVANPSVPISDLSFAELRRIFLGERQFWSSSLRIALLMHAPTARERDVLLKAVYEMSEAQLRQHWIGKVFRAEAASAPQTFYSDEEILETLVALPGSIAAVEVSRIPKGLKVIKIDGRMPGDQGYRLH